MWSVPLRCCRPAFAYWRSLAPEAQEEFPLPSYLDRRGLRFARRRRAYSTKNTAYQPTSPYSASKAASDHFVRAWNHTYGLPTIVTNCSNNYGPYHFPEKLIPLMILNALEGKPLPVYGKGDNVRDWLFVDDHARALILAAEKGRPGETYASAGITSGRTSMWSGAFAGSSTSWRPTVNRAARKADFVRHRSSRP